MNFNINITLMYLILYIYIYNYLYIINYIIIKDTDFISLCSLKSDINLLSKIKLYK